MSGKEKFSILVVDDDGSFRNAVRRQLSISRMDFPIHVLESSSAREALSLIGDEEVDCVLLDNMMPGMSGMDLLSEILEKHGGIAVIMVTGAGSEEIAVEAMKLGAMDYLVKGSVTPENLARAIGNAFDKIKMRKTIEEQQRELLDAERHRVMIQSLGAACHHIGQPATVISAYLDIMKQQEKSPELKKMIGECIEAAENIREVLEKLREVTSYRTVPYCKTGGVDEDRSDAEILAI